VEDPTPIEIVIRLSAAMLYGAVLGWERETHRKPAGLRTHMLVAVGSAGFTLMAIHLLVTVSADHARVDPLRVVEGVIGGIGFLGAGSIIQSRGSVEGITTAATIWVVGAVGTACGMAQYVLAGAIVGFAIVIVVVIRTLETIAFPHKDRRQRKE